MNAEKIGVVGAGVMGHGITQVMAQHGYEVILVDIKEELLKTALDKIKWSLEKFLEKGKITQQQKEETIKRIKTATNLEELKGCDVVIEAVPENKELKKSIFKKLDEICGDKTILATNTSSIPIAEIASATGREEKVIGAHFMNPPQIIKLVEVVKGEKTSEETVERIKRLCEGIDKVPIEVKDSPGFVLNRLLIPMVNEAVSVLEEGVATKEGIDQIMKLGAAHPMGPLELADLIGLDVCLDILKSMYEETGNERFKPCPLLGRMVKSGLLGRKTKKGFYDYT